MNATTKVIAAFGFMWLANLTLALTQVNKSAEDKGTPITQEYVQEVARDVSLQYIADMKEQKRVQAESQKLYSAWNQQQIDYIQRKREQELRELNLRMQPVKLPPADIRKLVNPYTKEDFSEGGRCYENYDPVTGVPDSACWEAQRELFHNAH